MNKSKPPRICFFSSVKFPKFEILENIKDKSMDREYACDPPPLVEEHCYLTAHT